MDPKQRNSKRAELVRVAEAMLRGEIHLIEGCRRICAIRDQIDDHDSPVFLPIEAFESETDHFPVGKHRGKYTAESLKRIDEEMKQDIDDAREYVLKACHKIIQVYSE